MNINEKIIRKSIDDIGVGAYLRMHGFKVVGRKGKTYYFDINIQEQDEFNRLIFEYANSQCHIFDAELMALKKMPHYVPPVPN